MKIYTIGYTKKTAQQFFEILANHKVQCVVDIRLRPYGQLAGFAKKEDLPYFLKQINGCDYIHMPLLAPDDNLLDGYRQDHDWKQYEIGFKVLMDARNFPEMIDKSLFEEKTCCLLCSESTPQNCHRRLVAEGQARHWKDVEIIHL